MKNAKTSLEKIKIVTILMKDYDFEKDCTSTVVDSAVEENALEAMLFNRTLAEEIQAD